jgi:hypothetical protein
MPKKSPQVELAEIRDMQRRLLIRERELLASLPNMAEAKHKAAPQPRPGWPMQRVAEMRAN